MSDLSQAVTDATTAEANLETRVAAHEANDAANIAALQKQIDDLKAGGGVSDAIANLQALASRMQAFDASAPPATGETTPTSS